ncbi:sensor histidine kinase [Cesiribacter andamanensis]|uniref:histidine kinase n=1 Tax=Cesiribacter andamanensis AMV16 TaxID=1279009 RepID=M7N2R4_9BACT|nr:sensor histidine kinase [Cesiribacter andamanensis]EMR01511.1 Non-motile and phage-resistance protein [Cesiribacter andamanensis AMV16]
MIQILSYTPFWRRPHQGLGLLLLLAFWPLGRLVAAPAEGGVQLGASRFLVDSFNQYTYRQVLALPDGAWTNTYTPLHQGSLWVRLPLENSSPQPQEAFLQLGEIPLMQLYLPRPQGVDSLLSGMFVPIDARSFAHHKPLFKLQLAGGEQLSALLRLDSQNRIGLPRQYSPLLKSGASLQRDQEIRLLTQGLFFGIILVMAFYNLLLFVAVRDVSYLWYVLSILGIGLYFFFYYGFSLQTIWRQQPLWNAYSFALIVPLTNLMRVMFTKTYLHTREQLPWLNRFLNGLALLCFVPMVLGLAAYWLGLPWYELTIDATGVLGTLVLLSMLLAGVLMYLRGYTPALFFIVANLLFVLGANMFIIKEMQLVADSLFTRYVVQLGVIAQVVLFSLGLAYRLKKARQQEAEHLLALARLEHEKEQERKELAEQQKAELEEKVHQRTAALQEKTEELQAAVLKLQESEEGLRQLNKIKDKLFSVVSHDLRGPVATLDSFISLITKHAAHISAEEMDKLSHKTRESVHNLSFLLDNLLNWSRAQMGTLTFKAQPVALAELVQKNVALYQLAAESKKLSLVPDVPKEALVMADRGMLDFIVRNLLSNAIKFTPAWGTIKLIVQEEGDSLQLQVSDTGLGISPAHLQRILDPDDTFSTPGTARERGTGLGLMLCQEFLALHGARLEVRSEPGAGSQFFFSLPRALPAPVSAAPDSSLQLG